MRKGAISQLQIPPTEIEISELLSILTSEGKVVLRRLAFQRDQLCADLNHVIAERDAAIVEAQQSFNDRAIMKAQLDRAEAERDRLRALIDEAWIACVDDACSTSLPVGFADEVSDAAKKKARGDG